MMDTRKALLEEIDAFLSQTGMTKSMFGDLATNDDKFVDRLRGGSGCNIRTLDRVRTFMREYRPPATGGKSRPKVTGLRSVA